VRLFPKISIGVRPAWAITTHHLRPPIWTDRYWHLKHKYTYVCRCTMSRGRSRVMVGPIAAASWRNATSPPWPGWAQRAWILDATFSICYIKYPLLPMSREVPVHCVYNTFKFEVYVQMVTLFPCRTAAKLFLFAKRQWRHAGTYLTLQVSCLELWGLTLAFSSGQAVSAVTS
jgi:hypothetical protein